MSGRRAPTQTTSDVVSGPLRASERILAPGPDDILQVDGEQVRRELEAFEILGISPPTSFDEWEKCMRPLRLARMDPRDAAREVMARMKKGSGAG
jgi:hypothetical protein